MDMEQAMAEAKRQARYSRCAWIALFLGVVWYANPDGPAFLWYPVVWAVCCVVNEWALLHGPDTTRHLPTATPPCQPSAPAPPEGKAKPFNLPL